MKVRVAGDPPLRTWTDGLAPIQVLMGLYGHSSGSLLINGRPVKSYVRASLHAHTTVCFQGTSSSGLWSID